MRSEEQDRLRTIVDREKLMTYKTCAACGRPFTLGEMVVLACGGWDGPPRYIHENEATFDPRSNIYVAQECMGDTLLGKQ